MEDDFDLFDKQKCLKLLDELSNKPSDYRFNASEIKLIEHFNPISNFNVRYAFYRGKSRHNAYIAFVIDSMANSHRR